MSTTLDSRRIVVTGAAQGLGLGIAQRLLSCGAKLLLADRDSKVEDLARDPRFRESACALVADLAEASAPQQVMQAAVREFGSVDGLVNCAAWSFHKALKEITVDEFDRVVAVNQRAPLFLSQHFANQLAASDQDPCIVNIASVNALVGNPGLSAYAGTKGALAAMTRSLAVELAPRVRVVVISPGSTLTDVTRQHIERGTIDPSQLLSQNLIPRFISVEEIADLVAFLFSPAARSVTGAHWVIDSGFTAH